MVKVLVFDTETTDKPPMDGLTWKEKQKNEQLLLNPNNINKVWPQVIHKWPHIIQLSYILYNTDKPNAAVIYNKYIDIPDNIIISKESINVHHITRETIKNTPSKNKVTIKEALKHFLIDITKADLIVGHSVNFDRKMIISELLRLSKEEYLSEIKDIMNDSKFECTNEKTKPICKLKPLGYKNKIKNPKLSEAYKHFFGYEPKSGLLHDALIDTIICLRVYLKYNNFPDVCGLNDIITNNIMKFSPPGYQYCINSNVKNKSYNKTKLNKTKRRKPKRKRRSYRK
jgi:DNA polymerase III epsilon subunit-like protein